MKIAVLGAGAWGTALAISAAPRHQVMLWARDADQAARMRTTRCNQRYLPRASLPAALHITADRKQAVAHGEGGLVVIATPMAALRECLSALPQPQAVLWLCKGFESATGALGHEIAQAVHSGAPLGANYGVLSGPSFAQEVAQGQATALVVASTSRALADAAVRAFHADALRLYTSDDVVGVEVGGAVKNVLAIATGMIDGLAGAIPQGVATGTAPPGLNARAALITRGLAEMTRLGVALGARAETFMGLSGLGDLVLTATGELSRNRRIGLHLAAGLSLQQALAELGHVAEGVYSADTVVKRARALGVEMPISEAVLAVIEGRTTPPDAMNQLMARQPRSELYRPSTQAPA